MCQPNRVPKLLPAVLVLGALLWMFTMTGGRDIFVNEMLSEAYDSHAEHLLRGDPGVDPDASRHESLIVGDKVRMYFGPFPAFVRIPLNFIYPSGRGCWSRLSGLCAGMIALAAFAGLIRTALRSSDLPSRWQDALGNVSLVGFALGSPLLLLLGNLSIYDEAIVWGFAWALAALYFALRSREAEGAAMTWSLLAFSLSAGAALLSRVTFGAPFVLIAPALALRLFRKSPIRNLVALFLPLAAALLFYLCLTYAKFGTFSGMPLRYSVNPTQREFAEKYGLFRLERVPLKAEREMYDHPTLYVMAFTETYSSLLWCSSWIVLGAVIGVAMLLRPGGSDAVERTIAAILFVQAIAILSFMGLCQRYTAEVFPFLVFAFLFFLRQGKTAFHLRYLLIGLVAVSVVINSLTTVSWLVDADMNVPDATRAKWKEFLGRNSRP